MADEAEHPGAVNILCRGSGNHDQDIPMRIYLRDGA